MPYEQVTDNHDSISAAHTRPRNLILTKLPEAQYAAIQRHLVPVDLPLGTRLSEPNQPIEYIYFPVSGLVSVDALTERGESVEVGVLGREGLTGIAGLLARARSTAP